MRKVLLIEDDETMLSLIELYLQMENFEVAHLAFGVNVEEALACVVQEKPTLVLLDVHLKSFDGFDLLKKIRTEPQLKTTRVLMCSGMDLSIESYQQGANGFLLKPYMPDELARRIREMIGE